MTSSLSCGHVTRLARKRRRCMRSRVAQASTERVQVSGASADDARPGESAASGGRWPPSLAAEHEAVVELSAAAGGTADQHLRGGHGRRDQGRYPLFRPCHLPSSRPFGYSGRRRRIVNLGGSRMSRQHRVVRERRATSTSCRRLEGRLGGLSVSSSGQDGG